MTIMGKKLANAFIKEGIIEKGDENEKAIVETVCIGTILCTAIPDSVLFIPDTYLDNFYNYIYHFNSFLGLTPTKYKAAIEVQNKPDNESIITISYEIEGKEDYFQLSQSDLIISDQFFDNMIKLAEKHLDGVFMSFYVGNDCPEYAYVSKEVYAVIKSINVSPENFVEIIENNNLYAYHNVLDSIGESKVNEIIETLNKDDELYVSKLLSKFGDNHMAYEFSQNFFTKKQSEFCLG